MSGGGGHWGISGCKMRIGIPDHLLQSSVQTGLAADEYCFALYHGNGIIFTDKPIRKAVQQAILDSRKRERHGKSPCLVHNFTFSLNPSS